MSDLNNDILNPETNSLESIALLVGIIYTIGVLDEANSSESEIEERNDIVFHAIVPALYTLYFRIKNPEKVGADIIEPLMPLMDGISSEPGTIPERREVFRRRDMMEIINHLSTELNVDNFEFIITQSCDYIKHPVLRTAACIYCVEVASAGDGIGKIEEGALNFITQELNLQNSDGTLNEVAIGATRMFLALDDVPEHDNFGHLNPKVRQKIEQNYNQIEEKDAFDELFEEMEKAREEAKNEARANSKCFIATSLLGSTHPDLDVLRNFRDTVLSKAAAGRLFIDWYNENGEYLATRIKRNSLASIIIRQLILKPIIFIIKMTKRK
ncbi:hypothetical protein J2T55_000197 [Methylohalomonas lacus]|uniref:Uncharacterized protein n=1 Tax=Methylohalomonas lacus TaxID=398773 RepID=A0AAE3HH62_9GAMM|nr:CFI-box-CTERM domain-containing protein [Methylohalomonas lacus]MCS3902205.1 hypothetical protein [Methylohalomonas lacus]